MSIFLKTTYLNEIIERSKKERVVIFKYSNDCGSSRRLKEEIEKLDATESKFLPIFLVVVQEERNLSNMITEMFEIKHESPQIIILDKGANIYEAHHGQIDLKKLVSEVV